MLSSLEITGTTKKWIKYFMTNREQRVVVNRGPSKTFNVCSGVPQGTVLGSLLFNTVINDMQLAVTSSTIRLFANDAIIYKTIKTSHDADILHHSKNGRNTGE